MSCKKAMTAATTNEVLHMNVYRAEVRSAVADLIGHKKIGDCNGESKRPYGTI